MNILRAFWRKGYQREAYYREEPSGGQLLKSSLPHDSNLQPLDYQPTALPYEMLKMSYRIRTVVLANLTQRVYFG